ncbi:MAG TPA: nitrate/nitrite transporter NrtS [Ktedonobacteraceae bacterium]|nr:nitrate/nitrite transporter NrtS [Ktedonobacteraceae bacterium]
MSAESTQPGNCTRCEQSLADRAAYLIDGAYRCLRCTLQYRPLLRRSAQTSLVVGTLLVAINQGAVLLQGHISPALLWEIPLTYLVPFCVSTWGALTNTRR